MSSVQGGRPERPRTVLDSVPELQRLLLDHTRCPNCATVLPGPACQACGIDLAGPDGAGILRLSHTAAGALEQRGALLGRLRAQASARALVAPPGPVAEDQNQWLEDARHPLGASTPQSTGPGPGAGSPDPGTSPQTSDLARPNPAAPQPGSAFPPSGAALPGPGVTTPAPGAALSRPGTVPPGPGAVPPGPGSVPAREPGAGFPAPGAAVPWPGAGSPVPPLWSPPPGPPRRAVGVNTILVGVGALLLAVAAIGFLIFSWRNIPLGGRAAVIGGATLAALGVAAWLRPRLPETAEAIGALAVVLVLGDTWAIRRTGLFGADRPDGLLYAGAALLTGGLIIEAWGRWGKVRAGTHAAAVLLPLGTYLLSTQLLAGLDAGLDELTWMLGLILGATVTLTRRTLPGSGRTERVLARITAAGMLLTATLPAWLLIPGPHRALLALLAVTAVLAAQTWADRPATDASPTVSTLPDSPGLPASLTPPAFPDPSVSRPDPVSLSGPTVAAAPNSPAASASTGGADVPGIPGSRGGPGVPVTPSGRGGATSPAGPGVLVNQGWSLATGVSAVGAAVVGGVDVTIGLGIPGLVGLIPVTVLTGLLVVGVSWLRPSPGAAVRRTALGGGVLGAATLVTLPTLALAVSQVVRPLSTVSARDAGATDRLDRVGAEVLDLDRIWLTSLVGLAVLAAVTWLASRTRAWPHGPWPRRVRNLLRRLPAALLAADLVLLTLAPAAAVVTTVVALIALSALAARAATRPGETEHGRGTRRPTAGTAPAPKLLWIISALTGVLAVALSWTTAELPGAVTALATAALLAARRQVPDRLGPDSAGFRALLALLAAGTAPAAVGVLTDQAGGDVPLAWAALFSGLVTAAFLAVPRLPFLRPGPTARPPAVPGSAPAPASSRSEPGASTHSVPGTAPSPAGLAPAEPVPGPGVSSGVPEATAPAPGGRAPWTGVDRLAAAAPGVVVIGLALSQSYADGDGPGWVRPALFAVALVVAVAGAIGVRPEISAETPLLPPVLAGSVTPVLGLLIDSGRPGDLAWALATGIGTLAVVGLVLTGRVDEQRRVGGEIGLLMTAFIALGARVGDQEWLVLLILGVCVAAVALTPGRERAGWGAGVLLTASSWFRLADADVHLVEAYSVPPAIALALVQLWAHRRNPATPATSPGLPGPHRRPLIIGIVPSVIAAGFESTPVRPAALLVLAGALVAAAYRDRRVPRELMLSGAVVAAGTALLRVRFELGADLTSGVPLTALEVWTVPAALILLLHGADHFQRLENRSAAGGRVPVASWPAFGPGLAALLLPGLWCGLAGVEGSPARPFLVLLAGAVTVAAGAGKRTQAPLLVGSGALIVEAVVLLAPWMRDIGSAVPLWAWAAVVGLALLVLGGGYEKRLAQVRTVRARIAALR